MSGDLADAEWSVFIAKLENAEEEFVRGRPAAFKLYGPVPMMLPFAAALAVWNADGKTSRSGWAGSVKKYSDGARAREEISRMVAGDFAYLVQKEVIHSRLGSQVERSTLELRATMVFRREADGWRIVHRHADSQIATRPPQ